MSETRDDLDRLLRTAGSGHRDAGHPEPAELIAYQADRLPEAERDRLRRHVAGCPSCAAAVLDLERFPDIPQVDGDPDPDRLRREDWQALAAEVGLADPHPAAGRLHALRAVAAVLLLALLGTLWWALSLQRQVDELSSPRANVLVHDLLPSEEGVVRGGGESLEIPPATEQVVLILSRRDLRRHDHYRVEIVDAEGEEIWSRGGLVPLPEGSFSVAVDPRILPSGPHRIRLLASDDGEIVTLASYLVDVRRAEPPDR